MFTPKEGVGLRRSTFGEARCIFTLLTHCRRVKCLSLEGCSLLTARGLEAVVLAWKDLQRLQVVSCNNIRDSEITPPLASLFSVLKELKWRPDTKSVIAASPAGTGMGTKGGRFFKRVEVVMKHFGCLENIPVLNLSWK